MARKKKALFDGINPDKDMLRFCEEVRRLYKLDREATDTQRKREEEEIRFLDPELQWSRNDRMARESSHRPCLTEDRVSPFIAQVANEMRQNRPMIQVSPTSEGARQETAEVIQGLIRHIETDSSASAVYDDAYKQAIQTGRGFYRIVAEYASEDSFDQEIRLKRIHDASTVFIDPSCNEPDMSDAQWGGITSWLWKEDFKATYPDSLLADSNNSSWEDLSENAPDWMNSDGGALMIVEFYRLEPKQVTICRMDDGSVIEEKDMPSSARPVMKRTTTRKKLMWYKLNALEVLEKQELPGSHIPIVAVLGRELVIENQKTWHGLIHHAIDPQRRWNHLITSQVERLAFTPIGGWVGYKGAFGEGKQREAWKMSNRAPIAFLEANPASDVNGAPMPLPKWEAVEPAIGSVNQALQFAQEGIKATLGMYDASIGNRESGQSGIAIQRLQRQGQTVNYDFIDNLARANRHAGRIILSWIPVYYDTERTIRIIGEDEKAKLVKINADGTEKDKQGNPIRHDLTIGDYDIVVSTGPGYQTKRQEDLALFMEMLTGPMGQQIAQACPDLAVSMMDSRAGKLMQERLKKILPPTLQEREDGEQQIPQQVKAMLDGLMQQHQMLTERVHQLTDELESKDKELSSKEKIALIDSRTRLITELIKLDAQSAKIAAEQELGMIDSVLQAQDSQQLRQQEQEPTPEMAQESAGEMTPAEGMQDGQL